MVDGLRIASRSLGAGVRTIDKPNFDLRERLAGAKH